MSKKKKKNKAKEVVLEQKILFNDGDLVKLNTERIRGHPDFHSLVFEYKHWVLSNIDTIFEITNEENVFGIEDLYLLKSGDTIHKWLVYSDNLIKVIGD